MSGLPTNQVASRVDFSGLLIRSLLWSRSKEEPIAKKNRGPLVKTLGGIALVFAFQVCAEGFHVVSIAIGRGKRASFFMKITQ